MEMSSLAKWIIRPRLVSIPGVANVAIWGERDRQLQVLVDPDRLRANNITLAEVEQAAGDAVELTGGGYCVLRSPYIAGRRTLYSER